MDGRECCGGETECTMWKNEMLDEKAMKDVEIDEFGRCANGKMRM